MKSVRICVWNSSQLNTVMEENVRARNTLTSKLLSTNSFRVLMISVLTRCRRTNCTATYTDKTRYTADSAIVGPTRCPSNINVILLRQDEAAGTR